MVRLLRSTRTERVRPPGIIDTACVRVSYGTRQKTNGVRKVYLGKGEGDFNERVIDKSKRGSKFPHPKDLLTRDGKEKVGRRSHCSQRRQSGRSGVPEEPDSTAERPPFHYGTHRIKVIMGRAIRLVSRPLPYHRHGRRTRYLVYPRVVT